jgi:hypothetical protein
MFFYRDTRWVHGKKSYTGILERETPGFMGILLLENAHLWIPVCNAPSNNIATICGVNFIQFFFGYKFQCFILGWNLFSKILDFFFGLGL